jgi:hypothetical protein
MHIAQIAFWMKEWHHLVLKEHTSKEGNSKKKKVRGLATGLFAHS